LLAPLCLHDALPISFFAVDLSDHVRACAPGAIVEGPLAAAREIVQELRRERFSRSPGSTARDLLERTAFARTIALGPNGTQRLRSEEHTSELQSREK